MQQSIVRQQRALPFVVAANQAPHYLLNVNNQRVTQSYPQYALPYFYHQNYVVPPRVPSAQMQPGTTGPNLNSNALHNLQMLQSQQQQPQPHLQATPATTKRSKAIKVIHPETKLEVILNDTKVCFFFISTCVKRDEIL